MRTRTTLTVLASVALVFAPTGPATAQGIDFTGTWQLDRDASEFPEFGGRRGGGRGGGGFGGGRGGPGGVRGGAATLVIAQTADLLTIEQQSERGTRTLSYRLDDSESSNEGPRGDLTSTSAWDGSALVTEGTQQLSTPRGDFSIDIVERRTLSDDGQTMTIESARTMPFGDTAMILVYTKSTT